jgi:hypothetical protein
MILLYEVFFASSWNCTVWVYSPEISPLKFRHINSALAIMAEWAFTFLTVMMAPPAIANTGWKIYIFFVVFNFLQIPFVYFFCPETAGKSLEELDLLFAGPTEVGTMQIEGINCENPEKVQSFVTEIGEKA